MSAWGSFPRWVGKAMKEFPSGPQGGAHMSALRTYLALALIADFDSRTAQISWGGLQDLTGVSKPMVQLGLATAVTKGLIAIDKTRRRHTYQLLSNGDATFTQVPFAAVSTVLRDLPVRGHHALDALKLYITLLSVRGRNSKRASIGHERIIERCGLQPKRVRAAIDVLVNHGLVHVQMAQHKTWGHPHNEYLLQGEFSAGGDSADDTIGTFKDALAEF